MTLLIIFTIIAGALLNAYWLIVLTCYNRPIGRALSAPIRAIFAAWRERVPYGYAWGVMRIMDRWELNQINEITFTRLANQLGEKYAEDHARARERTRARQGIKR